MSFFGAGIGRVPNILLSRAALSSIERTSQQIFRASGQISTGREIQRPSDDAVRASAITDLDARLERSTQKLRNLSLASGTLGVVDTTLNELANLAQEARSLAVGQANVGPSAGERSSQAVVVQSQLESLLRLANQTSLPGYIFGGTRPGTAPVEEISGAYRFAGEFGGLTPDIGIGGRIPITLGAGNAIGSLSSRVEGTTRLDPALTLETRIADLRGARSLGVELGVIEAVIDGTDLVRIDLSRADTIGDVLDRIAAELIRYEQEETKDVLAPTGASVDLERLKIDLTAGSTIEFRDIEGSTVAQDLGLVKTGGAAFALADPFGADLAPKLTKRTPIAALQALSAPLGRVEITNNGFTTEVDLAGALTIADIESRFESAGVLVRVELNPDGESLNIVNELAASADRALSITDADDSTQTATRLGIRSFQATTPIADFNFGRGVEVLSQSPDPNLNVDFSITLESNPPGTPTTIRVDLRPADIATVGTVLSAINSQIATQLAAAGRPATDLTAALVDGQNGFALIPDAAITTPVTVSRENNSPAAEQLGFTTGAWDAANNRFVSADRATVRVDNVFTHLIDLADALRGDNTFGIQLASEKLESAAGRLTELRALVGGYAARVEDETRREEDRSVLDTQIRSGLRDADFAAVASEYSLLQTQLEAGLRTTASQASLSLLDFIR